MPLLVLGCLFSLTVAIAGVVLAILFRESEVADALVSVGVLTAVVFGAVFLVTFRALLRRR